MCAMMQKLRIRSGGVALGANAERAMGDTWDEPRRVRVTGMVLVGGRPASDAAAATTVSHALGTRRSRPRGPCPPPTRVVTHNGGHARPTHAGPARGPRVARAAAPSRAAP